MFAAMRRSFVTRAILLLFLFSLIFPGATPALASDGESLPNFAAAGAAVNLDDVSYEGPLPYVPGEVLVRYKKGISAASLLAFKSEEGLRTEQRLADRTGEVLKIGAQSVPEAIEALTASGLFEWVQPNYIYRPASVSPDYASFQWGLHNVGQNILGQTGVEDVDIDAPEGWPYLIGESLRKVIVAVIDTGIDIDHEDLQDVLWQNDGEIPGDGLDNDGNGFIDDVSGWNFYDNSADLFIAAGEDDHGTHVAGTIGAAFNEFGVYGVSPRVEIMAIKVLGPTGGTTSDLINAITYAKANGASILNMSLGGPAFDQALYNAIESSGLLVVAAAGNAGKNADTTPSYPAAFDLPNIISVASVNNRAALSSFSNYGKVSVDVGAPGEFIASTIPTGEIAAGVWNQTGQYDSLFLGFNWSQLHDDSMDLLMASALTAFDPTSILLVDDSEDGIAPSYAPQFAGAISKAGFANTTLVTVPRGGNGPDATTLSDYDLVIWFTEWADRKVGDTVNTLTNADLQALTTYLNDGGNLMLSGLFALEGIEQTPFVSNVLGLRYLGETGGYDQMIGVAESPFAGQTFVKWNGENFHEFNGALLAIAPTAEPVLHWRTNGVTNDGYAFMSGTSMAAPHVSGIMAAAYSQKNLTPEEAIDLAIQTGKSLPALQETTASGVMPTLKGVLATSVNLFEATTRGSGTQTHSFDMLFVPSQWGRLKPGDTITITFPDGVNLPDEIPADSIIIDFEHEVEVDGGLLYPDDQSLTFPVPITLEPSEGVWLHIGYVAGITVTGVADDAHLEIATSADPEPVQSNPVVWVGQASLLAPPVYQGIGGHLFIDQHGIHFLGGGYVYLDDWTADVDPWEVDSVIARISSQKDPTGIEVALTEIEETVGEFRAFFGFTFGDSDEGEARIAVNPEGDVITIAVGDTTTTATWKPADQFGEQIALIGAFNYDSEAHDIDEVSISLFGVDGSSPEAIVQVWEPWDEVVGPAYMPAAVGPTLGLYSVLISAADAGEYVVTASAPGFAVQSAPVMLDDQAEYIFKGDIDDMVLDLYGYILPAFSLQADAQAPEEPTVTFPTNGQKVADEFELKGTTEPYALVTLTIDEVTDATLQTRAGANGAFRFNLAGLAEGSHSLSLTAADLAGNESGETSLEIQVDAVPLTLSIDPIHAAMTTLTGTAKPGATISFAGEEIVANETGHFSFTVDPQPAGTVLTVDAADDAGRETSETTTVWPVPTPVLSTLTLSAGTLNFNPAVQAYNVTVSSSISSLTVNATPGNPWVTVRINGEAVTSKTLALAYGRNTITVVADLGEGQITTYTVTITRSSPPSPPSTPPSNPPVVTPPVVTPPPGPKPEPEPEPQPQPEPQPAPQTGILTLTSSHVGNLPPQSSLQVDLGADASGQSIHTVVVPAEVLSSMAGNGQSLTLSAGQAQVQLPLQALAAAAGGADLRISAALLNPANLPADAPAEIAAAAAQAKSQGLTAAGPVLLIQAIAGANGQAITQLGGTWQILMPINRNADPALLGIYWHNPATGAWEYVGGKVDLRTGTISTTLDHFSQFTVFAYAKTFADVPLDHWAHDAIQQMAAKHIVKGVSENSFAPANNVTRAEFITLLTRALDLKEVSPASPTFSDVARNHWYFGAVESAAKAGLITGEGGLFRPNDLITRQEMAVILMRALNQRGLGALAQSDEVARRLAPYADADQVGEWAKPHVAAAIRLGLITGRSASEYAPTANATRAEAVVVLQRLLDQIGR